MSYAGYVPMVNTEQMHAAASYLSKNWGEDGYRIGIEDGGHHLGATFRCRHSDGSEFRFLVDRYGNVSDIPDEEAT